MALAAIADAEARALALWERAVGLGRWARDEALLGGRAAAPAAMGARNAALLAMRNAVFDAGWPLRSQCPECGAQVEFVADSHALARQLDGSTPTRGVSVEWRGETVELRAPTAQDLAAVAYHCDRRSAARALLARCGALEPERVDDAALDELGLRIEALDPAALVSFALDCPACGHGWDAPLDVAEALWSELRDLAERTLSDVDALARTYGWSEAAVLGLSPARRAAYLQLVDAR